MSTMNIGPLFDLKSGSNLNFQLISLNSNFFIACVFFVWVERASTHSKKVKRSTNIQL